MFVELDEDGNKFMNVSFRTGRTGQADDLALVQELLRIIFRSSPFLKNPVKNFENYYATGRPNPETPLLIAAFQKQVLRRPKPEGYVNCAISLIKRRYTIHALNYHAAVIYSSNFTPDYDLLISRMSDALGWLPASKFEVPEVFNP